MYQRLIPVFVVILLAGCGQPEPSPVAPVVDGTKEVHQVQVQVGDDDYESPYLPFKITALYEGQTPSTDAPYHVNGGDWTFFDCQADSDSSVVFTVGVTATSASETQRFAWGKAIFMVKNREAGGKFVEAFSEAFGGTMPTLSKQAFTPEPLRISTAILGDDLVREDKGGFSGTGGGWTATKWFPEHDGRSAEIFFNYNLGERKGEFSEKDVDYGDGLVAIFASALRDGPRPERTPENDPNLTLIGPKIGTPHKLLSDQTPYQSFSPNSQFAVYQDETTILALDLGKPDSEPFAVVHFEHSPWSVHVLDDDLNLLVQEGIPETPGVKNSADPMRIWWVDGTTKEKTLIRGPEKDLDLADSPISPDHRYVAVSQWRGEARNEPRTKLLHIIDRESGATSLCQLKGKDLTVIGWKNAESELRMVAVTNRWQFDTQEESELYLIDPTSGELQRQVGVDARLDLDNPLSPDGTYRVGLGEGELVVTDVKDGQKRHFRFHEYDLEFVGDCEFAGDCVAWVSPRYLKFNGPRLALIDVTTMKMCFPATADRTRFASYAYTFSPDFRWVMYEGETTDGEALFLASVEMPKEP